jgi:copper(I)-binding protein
VSTTPKLLRGSLALAGALVLAAGPLAACGSDTDKDAKSSGSTITMASSSAPSASDVWARTGTTGGTSAIYMKIVGGKDADALTGVEVPSDVATSAQIHETMKAGDMGSSTTMGGSGMGSSTTMGGSGMGSSTTMGGSGMMGMQEVAKVDLPAGGTVEFKPGGYHVMLNDLKKDLAAGDTIKVTLTFEKAGKVTGTATVKDV